MSGADEIVYDEFPEAIRRVRAALLEREMMAEAAPLALQLLEHGWKSGPLDTPIGLAWDRLGLEGGMSVELLFPEACDFVLLVTPRVDDEALLAEGQDLALATADALDLMGMDTDRPDTRRRALADAAEALRAAVRWPG